MATAAASLTLSAASCQQQLVEGGAIAYQKDKPVKIQKKEACKKATSVAKPLTPPQKAQRGLFASLLGLHNVLP